ncbi:quinolinate synthase NadA [Dissulfurirhabdus thermomarina]|uniref:Quinolinate synthase n=1 Tax=Dissulfurirhabdus thermomarina TaxID=1765737 RepID=A0A6N9TMK1_DISTH|nr:quinolinate synthase NadA [Dissulfurirhabdus thermomarina]NDY42359.1 quinolinate synthase NadA [Dissulfurirhabdus thermomarina]NMX23013.1 quinolinate synthase NadA [Dissulfurirhabdus thermomarina]
MTDTLVKEIRRLAAEKQAIILAHNYQPPEIQEVADLTGDSLELAIRASKTDARVIVFCGVHFMAETGATLCPDKRVLLPNPNAGCAMADMLTADELREAKAALPGVPVVTYVNSTAEVKAESDICCTSANAVQVVKSLGTPEVLMVPDRNLALWTQRHTSQKIHHLEGYCPVHDNLTAAAVAEARRAHPGAVVMAHPECPPEVIDAADVVRSTSGMLAYPGESDAGAFIVATETGLLHPLAKRYPQKRFYPASADMVCADMKLTTLADVRRALETGEPAVTVPEPVRVKALRAVERMIAVPRD